jgi:hypothetical protein
MGFFRNGPQLWVRGACERLPVGTDGGSVAIPFATNLSRPMTNPAETRPIPEKIHADSKALTPPFPLPSFGRALARGIQMKSGGGESGTRGAHESSRPPLAKQSAQILNWRRCAQQRRWRGHLRVRRQTGVRPRRLRQPACPGHSPRRAFAQRDKRFPTSQREGAICGQLSQDASGNTVSSARSS